MRSSNLGFRSKFVAFSLALALVTLWLVMRGYHGLTGDGQIYAFQAFARLYPQLRTDLYLQNTSQDQFTLFSPLYAWCIDFLGLENAARLLTLLFTLWFLAAAWSLARAVAGRNAAWAAVAFALIAAGDYGASGVFRILEPYLTARLPAEALCITALACQVRGRKWLGLALAVGALAIHPLMALPGLLLLGSLWVPPRVVVTAAIGGVLATLVISIVAINIPGASHVFAVMDDPWLDVVRERSQFLFLQLWSTRDWAINAQPFLCLGFTAIAVRSDRIRRLCVGAALVGAAGLAVALIGGLIGPVAILVQGQAWRWVWVAVLLSELLLPLTALKVGRDEKCGPLCALLLVFGWTLPGIDGTACIGLASIIWLARPVISSRGSRYCRWAFTALIIAIGMWIFIQCRNIWSPPSASAGPAPLVEAQLREMFALKMPAVLLCALIWWGVQTARTKWTLISLTVILAAFSALVFSAAFRQPRLLATSADIREFAAWANVIPPTSTVLVTPPRDVGAFVWFALNRPNYLSLDQSAGVVFSRATALEVRRRSDVLLPLADPDWKLLSRLRHQSGGGFKDKAATRPLTAGKLIQICADPQLAFVISPEAVGFNPLPHIGGGVWKDWKLYDCRKVRSALPTR
jgi:hypothetical protein